MVESARVHCTACGDPTMGPVVSFIPAAPVMNYPTPQGIEHITLWFCSEECEQRYLRSLEAGRPGEFEEVDRYRTR